MRSPPSLSPPRCHAQGIATKSGHVVSALNTAFIPPDAVGSKMTFKSEKAVLGYINNTLVMPFWKDPQCGDGQCERPWEFPAWGVFGCRAGAHSSCRREKSERGARGGVGCPAPALVD